MDHMNMDHGDHDEHDHGMEMAMQMVFTLNTKVTILFSWWTTTTVISYVLTLLLLFVLACINRFLGILKLQLDQRPNNLDHEVSDMPKLALPLARWTRNRNSKDRMSPLPPHVEVNHNDTDRYGAFPTATLLGPTSPPYPNQCEDAFDVINSHPRSFRPHRKWCWRHDGKLFARGAPRPPWIWVLTSSKSRMLAVMTYNVGVLCAVVAGVVVGELFLGRFSPPSPGWQDGACHDG
ncbi:copper transporter crmD [Penicillium sp. IBT 16267x]|nr:copper transporter crmD [Penicillium sp. IBT 16267x]